MWFARTLEGLAQEHLHCLKGACVREKMQLISAPAVREELGKAVNAVNTKIDGGSLGLNDIEVELSNDEFDALRHYLSECAGIEIPDGKKSLITARLSRRLHALGMRNFAEYLALLRCDHSDENQSFINSVTTNVTSFFREGHHFDDLRDVLMAARAEGRERIRIWSAGCSNGKEAYSIGMVARQVFGTDMSVDLKILATDIDTDALEYAHNGVYSDEEIEGLPAEYAGCVDGVEGGWQVLPSIQDLVTFRRLNLIDDWPMSGPFDVIFCRNVLIYFGQERQVEFWRRAGALLAPGGRLYVGHSETLGGSVDGLSLVGRTTYHKVTQGEGCSV